VGRRFLGYHDLAGTPGTAKMKRRISRWILTAALAAILPVTVLAEETYPIFKWLGDQGATQEPYPGGKSANRVQQAAVAKPDILREVAAIQDIEKENSRRYYLDAPATPEAAMAMLDSIDVEINRLAIAVNQFSRSKQSLVRSIDRLAEQSQRNRMRISGWMPVLMGDLRLMRASRGGDRDDLWMIVALVILERQLEHLGRRQQYTHSNDALTAKLRDQEGQLEGRRQELMNAIADIRGQLSAIRRKAHAGGHN
jgi:hypothetical protein